MEPERWRRIASLFDEALRLPGDERRAFLDRVCADDPALRGPLSELLAAADRATGFLESPLHQAAGSVLAGIADPDSAHGGDADLDDGGQSPTAPPSSADPGHERIGPYRLVAKIGEGGMGEVWRAEQRSPIRRQVALKLIKSGMDTRQVVARFEAERQALAWMDHPAIARVYDAGMTPRGLPYFVMELVAGESITSYCDRQRLSVSQRIELFLQVCDGVQHAHQRGIIHRDLKPSNILVSIQDGTPVPKIIDFGVAKATTAPLTGGTLFTHLGMMIGTPEYMSPEQAETSAGIDIRADVYSLGVVLYELLTGTLPFDFRDLRDGAWEEIRRQIRESEPQRPSARLSALGRRAMALAGSRRTQPGRLVSHVRGELDWILLRALEKDRTRRYGSCGELAADLGRFLRHEPVEAGPPSTAYRARKFVRRHRVGVAVAAIVALGLVSVTVVTSVQARRIARERDRADHEAKASARVTEFLIDLFRVSNPSTLQGATITTREVLDRGADRVKQELEAEPLIQARLLMAIGNVYTSLGLYDRARDCLEVCLAKRLDLLGEEDRDTLMTMQLLAAVYMHEGHFGEAENLARRSLDVRRRVLGEDNRSTLASADLLGRIYSQSGNPRAAAAVLQDGLSARRRALGKGDRDALESQVLLANSNLLLGRYPLAEEQAREALERQLRLFGQENLRTLESRSVVAQASFLQGKYREAEALYREGLEISERIYGPEHRASLQFQAGLAAATFFTGRRDEAWTLQERALEISRRSHGPESRLTSLLLFQLGMMKLTDHQVGPAEALFREVSDHLQRTAPDSYHAHWALNELGLARRLNGDLADAERILQRAVETGKRVLGPEHPHVRDSMRCLADVYADQGRDADAEVLYGQALAAVPPEDWQDPRVRSASLFGLALLEAQRGDRAQAMDLLRQAADLGFDGVPMLAGDPRLDSVRDDPTFAGLVAAVQENSLRPPASPTP